MSFWDTRSKLDKAAALLPGALRDRFLPLNCCKFDPSKGELISRNDCYRLIVGGSDVEFQILNHNDPDASNDEVLEEIISRGTTRQLLVKLYDLRCREPRDENAEKELVEAIERYVVYHGRPVRTEHLSVTIKISDHLYCEIDGARP